jgi:hypothetical protein
MVRIVRHRQPKGPATDRPNLTHRATSRLHHLDSTSNRSSPVAPVTRDAGSAFLLILGPVSRSPQEFCDKLAFQPTAGGGLYPHVPDSEFHLLYMYLLNCRGGRRRQLNLDDDKSFARTEAATSQFRLARGKSLRIRWAVGFDPHRPYQNPILLTGFPGQQVPEVPKGTSRLRRYRFDPAHRLALIVSQYVPVNTEGRRSVRMAELPLSDGRAGGLEKHGG